MHALRGTVERIACRLLDSKPIPPREVGFAGYVGRAVTLLRTEPRRIGGSYARVEKWRRSER
jgi:hypothetical protein